MCIRDSRTYEENWLAFIERFNEVLPTMPIYSNIYFDFFTDCLLYTSIPEGTAYTVTETVPAADGYAMTATGESGDIVAEKTAEAKFENHRDVGSLTITCLLYTSVSGLSTKEYSGYFVLEPYTGTNMTGAVVDTVTVKNTYASEGSLTITGKKLFNGIEWTGTAGEYTFALSSEDDPAFTGERVVKVQASGDFSFNLEYDFDTHLKGKSAPVTYTYELSEKKGDPADGLIYDETVYTITVTLTEDVYKRQEFYLPTGTYTVTETHVGGVELSEAEKAYFSIINDNTTFTIAATDTAKELDFENPGKGILTILKTDDKEQP